MLVIRGMEMNPGPKLLVRLNVSWSLWGSSVKKEKGYFSC